MGDDGGFSGGASGGFGDSSTGFGNTSDGFGDSSKGFGADNDDFSSNSFSGKNNGATNDSRYSGEDSHPFSSADSDANDRYHKMLHDSELIDEDRVSTRDLLTVLGAPGEKSPMNGDAVFSPMLLDEGDSGLAYGREPAYPERNPCEDCFFGTLDCCNCTIL